MGSVVQVRFWGLEVKSSIVQPGILKIMLPNCKAVVLSRMEPIRDYRILPGYKLVLHYGA